MEAAGGAEAESPIDRRTTFRVWIGMQRFEITAPPWVGRAFFSTSEEYAFACRSGTEICATKEIWARDGVPPRLESAEGLPVVRNPGAVFLYDRLRRIGQAWYEPGRAVDPWEQAQPLRLIIAWALEPHGALVHGAAVGVDSRVILLAGPSGVGKSTLAAEAIADGMQYYGDDWIALFRPGAAGPDPVAASVYSTLKLSKGSRLDLGFRVQPSGILHPDKNVFFAQTMSHGRLRAIVIPEISTGGTTIAPISPSRALRALGVWSVLQSPQTTSTLSVAREACERVPCFRLAVSEPRFVPGILRSLCRM